MTVQPMTCERCGDRLERSYSTTAYFATGQTFQLGPDGTGATFHRGGIIACSWTCLAVLAAKRAVVEAQEHRPGPDPGRRADRRRDRPPHRTEDGRAVTAIGTLRKSLEVIGETGPFRATNETARVLNETVAALLELDDRIRVLERSEWGYR